MSMSALLSLPDEIVHNVLGGVNAEDLATLSRCCRALHKFIYKNQLLCRELYLQILARNSLGLSKRQIIRIGAKVLCRMIRDVGGTMPIRIGRKSSIDLSG